MGEHGFIRPNNAALLGTIRDPHSGEPVEVYADALSPAIPYRRINGTFGDALTPEAVEDWPTRGLHDIYLSNGRLFGEQYLERTGWWSNTNIRYMPLGRRNGPLWTLLIHLVEGRDNGYPMRDVWAFAIRDALRRW